MFATCEDTTLKYIFENLAGGNLTNKFSLVKFEKYESGLEALGLTRIYTYPEACRKELKLKDMREGNSKEISLRPVLVDFTNFEFSKVAS